MADTVSLPFHRATKRPPSDGYAERRDALEHYFDRTAADKWRALTDADETVSRIRATVRAGRDEMRALILSWLDDPDIEGMRLYDAGCGTGALAVAAAERGAAVLAVDLSPTMVGIARERTDVAIPEGTGTVKWRVDFRAGDMLAGLDRTVDLVAAMDSLIHYELADVLAALTTLAPNVRRSIVFTFAPRTPMLAIKHTVGGLFPRHDKAPEIVPIAPRKLFAAIEAEPGLAPFKIHRTERVHRGFYTSQAVELRRR
ncbi:MAG: magnesium protoporphyrin IX methyltransferase [Pseudomonadota bacterium]